VAEPVVAVEELQGLAFGREVLDRFIRMEAPLACRPGLEMPELRVASRSALLRRHGEDAAP
jgi:hypothetical protein